MEVDDKDAAQVQGLLVATADYGDKALNECVREALGILRRKMKMDVVFVSKFEGGQRRFMVVDTAPGRSVIHTGGGDPLEQSWCYHIVEGRLPQFIKDAAPLRASGEAPATPLDIGTHLSVPVMLRDGSIYGTVCMFAFHVNDEVSLQDVWRLRAVADLLAKRLEPN